MSGKLEKPLARPVVLKSSPPRTLDTLLSAVELLNAGTGTDRAQIDSTLDQLMAAASSGDPAMIETVTSRLEQLLRQRDMM